MTGRSPILAAAVAAIAALAVGVASAAEAVQWGSHAEAMSGLPAGSDAMLEPGAWTVGRGEATQFHDGMARDTMSSRADVRRDLSQARARGLVADAGDAGASERVWARRGAFVSTRRDRELARNTAVQTSPDPIGEIAAMVAGR